MNYTITIIILAIVLILIAITREFLHTDSFQHGGSVKKRNKTDFIQKNKRSSLVKKAVADALFETIIVVLGCFVAILLTAHFESRKDFNNVYELLKDSGKDLTVQVGFLDYYIEKHKQGDMSLESLIENASIDTAFIEEIIYRDDIIRITHGKGYSSILYDYRNIKAAQRLLTLDENKTEDNTIALLDLIKKSAESYSYVVELINKCEITHEISEQEFVERIDELAKTKENYSIVIREYEQ